MLGEMAYLVRRFKPLIADQSGGVALIFGFAAVAILGVGGLAVDYSVFMSTRSKLQQALDGAVLAGVSSQPNAELYSARVGGISDEDKLSIAQTFFDGNRGSLPRVDNISFTFENGNLVGRATAHVPPALISVLGFSDFSIANQSAATADPLREPMCIMAMHPTRKHTLELHDSVSIVGKDCNIYGNSDHFDDVVDPHTDQNFIVGKSVQAVGFGHHYIANVTPPLEHAPEVLSDPLQAMVIPGPTTCDFTNLTVTGGAQTLTPGTYT